MHESPRLPTPAPLRFERPSLAQFLVTLLAVGFFIVALDGVGASPGELIDGLPQMARLVGEMFPPDLSRLEALGASLLTTFQMAFVGTVLGVILSVPLAVLASRTQSPHPLIYSAARGLISLFRTVPDLVWGLIFVVTVGLGAFAGTLALMVDAIGFCGRFFAEAMEEVDPGPQEALRAMGASKFTVVACAVIPAAMPSFINTSLFSLEKATRASVILGLVGAGGIGIELKVAMDLFNYPLAATIILGIFGLVLVVEQVSSLLRRRIMQVHQ